MIIISALAAGLLGLTDLPPQPYEKGRCRTFLWTRSEAPVRLAMIDEQTRTIRLRRGKQMFDIAMTGPNQYAGHGYRITLTLEYGKPGDIQNGSMVESGAMRIEQIAGGESMVVPVGGMRACG